MSRLVPSDDLIGLESGLLTDMDNWEYAVGDFILINAYTEQNDTYGNPANPTATNHGPSASANIREEAACTHVGDGSGLVAAHQEAVDLHGAGGAVGVTHGGDSLGQSRNQPPDDGV